MGLLGAHVSISGGVEKSISRGEELECDAIQVFSKNQRQWKAAPLRDDSIRLFRENLSGSRIRGVVIHDSYLINLAHPDGEARKKSLDAFSDEMTRADLLGIPYLVFHPGSHLKSGEEEGIRQIATCLNDVLNAQPDGKVQLLIETTAGQGDHLGYRFEHLAEMIKCVENQERMGICLDTAHVFEAGYDLRSREAYENTFAQFESIIGLDRLKVFHLNDSKSDFGSRVDRHENIGKGLIGEEAFRHLVNDRRFEGHPMVLETPGGDEKYRENLKLLRSFWKREK